MDIESKVKRLVSIELGLGDQVFSMDSNFSDLGADSLDAVELIMAIEDEFDIEITDEEAQGCVNVNAIVALVSSKLN